MLLPLISLTPLLILSSQVGAHQYELTETYAGHNFLSGFDFMEIPDPTHGRV